MQKDTSKSKEGRASSVKGFLVLSRIPFLLPGLAALTTSILLAYIDGYDPPTGLVTMSILGIAVIMLATYYFNEYFDFEGDRLNKKFTQFSGGSRALPDNMVPRMTARIAGCGAIAILAFIAVVYLLVYFEDYPLLLPLALFGAFCGVFYSSPPFQWAYQGIGEIMIGGCYGILAFVSGYYLASGDFDLRLALIGMPAALTIFGVIAANEFPDYEADKAVNKRNIVVRLGVKSGSVVYVIAMALAYPFLLSSMLVGVSWTIALTGLPVLLFSGVAILLTLKGGYADRQTQIKISGLTLLANLAASLMFIPAFYIQGL
jgi:1,4-dihydroxy-2-naphthoate octaprenyltransferase